MSISRRNFISGLAAGIAAPAIVRPGILMPIRGALLMPPGLMLAGWSGETWLLDGIDEHGRRVIEQLRAHEFSRTTWREVTGVEGRPPFAMAPDMSWPRAIAKPPSRIALAPGLFQPTDGKKPGF